MEIKDFAERVIEIKNDIISNIKELIPNSGHRFKRPFYVHYIEAETATTEVCHSVDTLHGGALSIDVARESDEIEPDTETIEGEMVLYFDTGSLIDIYNNLWKELREEKLSRLRELVAHNGKKISFDGSFKFDGIDCGEYIENCHLDEIELVDGALTFKNTFGDDQYDNDESFVEYSFLDEMIAYVEKQTSKKYTVQVSGSFSRVWEIEASTYQEAIRKAKNDWMENPLYDGDVNGEDWRSWRE